MMNMPKKLSLLTAIVGFSLVNIAIYPTTAKAQNSNAACKQAIANAKTRLQQVPNVLIEKIWTRNATDYRNFPPNLRGKRPIEYIFHLTAPTRNRRIVATGINKVMQSTQLQMSISQDVISKCSQVSAVTFGSSLTPGCGVTYGIMRDGKIKQFEDVNDPSLLQWGKTYCN